MENKKILSVYISLEHLEPVLEYRYLSICGGKLQAAVC